MNNSSKKATSLSKSNIGALTSMDVASLSANRVLCSILTREIEFRRIKNRAFSARAFAKLIGLPQSTLANVMACRQSLSACSASKIAGQLKLSAQDSELFICAAAANSERNRASRAKALIDFDLAFKRSQSVQLNVDEFVKVNQWHLQAMLELFCMKNVNQTPSKIAAYLEIETEKVIQSIEFLLANNWVKEVDGRLQTIESNTKVSSEVKSIGIRTFHAQMINKAQDAAMNGDVDKRLLGCVMFPVSIQRIPDMKKRMEEFRQAFSNEFEDTSGSAIYAFATQAFPLAQNIQKLGPQGDDSK